MKKITLKLLGLIFAASFIGCTSSSSNNESNGENLDKTSETSKVSDFFPDKLMTKVFSGGFENEGMKHVVLSIENNRVQILQEDTGTNLVLIYEVSDEKIELIFSEEEYYSTKKVEDVIPNRNNTILKAPLEVGTKWDSEHGGFFEITAVDLEITTPAGAFKAIEVTFWYDEYITKYYYAKNLGLIKTISDYATTELVEIK